MTAASEIRGNESTNQGDCRRDVLGFSQHSLERASTSQLEHAISRHPLALDDASAAPRLEDARADVLNLRIQTYLKRASARDDGFAGGERGLFERPLSKKTLKTNFTRMSNRFADKLKTMPADLLSAYRHNEFHSAVWLEAGTLQTKALHEGLFVAIVHEG